MLNRFQTASKLGPTRWVERFKLILKLDEIIPAKSDSADNLVKEVCPALKLLVKLNQPVGE
jgi:hypothetical protein